jgi:hypothetical protein
MDDVTILGGDERRIFQKVLGTFGAPAFIRRARQVQDALDDLLHQCQCRREELLEFVRLNLATLLALAGGWQNLSQIGLSETQLVMLRQLHQELNPHLRISISPTSSLQRLQRGFRDLQASMEFFNRRWRDYIFSVDLTHVNNLREGYNRFYILEKECAVRSPRIARQGFTRLPPITHHDLLSQMPGLTEIVWNGQ